MPIIRCEGLVKSSRIADKQPGLAGTLRHLPHPSTGRAEVAGFLPQRRQAEFLQSITLVMPACSSSMNPPSGPT